MAAEGDQYMTLAITPSSTINRLLIETNIQLASSISNNSYTIALFQDATQAAIAACVESNGAAGANSPTMSYLRHEMAAGTVSSTTFNVRAGTSSAATMTFNGAGAARLLGGIIPSAVRITEIFV